MESITLIVEALITWNKWFSARNQCLDDCNEKWMNKYIHHVDEKQDGSSEGEESEEYSEKEEECKIKNKARKKNKNRIMRHLKE